MGSLDCLEVGITDQSIKSIYIKGTIGEYKFIMSIIQ